MVAVLGKTAYGQAFGLHRVEVGRQPERFEGAELWVLPNPSGLNAHETVDTLAAAYGKAAQAAGLALAARGETLSRGERHETAYGPTEDSAR